MADVTDDIKQTRAMRVAQRRIEGFSLQFGEADLNLARHAAFPLVLTPDLLYQIWYNFVPKAPWTAVAHVLLSRLCRQVGYEMYEMDIADRNLLLRELKEEFGQTRFDELGEFLLDYVSQRLTDDDADTQDLREAQEWTALAYTKPDEAARELVQRLSEKTKREDTGEMLRLASLMESLAKPLEEAGFEPLLTYSRRIAAFTRGTGKAPTNQDIAEISNEAYPKKHQHSWTVMVYMAGDNGKVFEQLQGKRLMTPLEAQGYQDIAEMEAVGSTPEVAVLVQFDTLSDREHTYRIYVRPANEPRVIENIPEQNTGDPRALRDFIVWGIENYPAENYAVIIWGHSAFNASNIYDFARPHNTVPNLNTGFLGIAFDDSSLDFLDDVKLPQAFQEAEAITGKKISLICMEELMSTVEVAYQLRENANYMVASQEVEPLTGYPYAAILHNLTSNPETTPEDLARLIVQEYGRYYEGKSQFSQITLSAINLRVIEKVVEALGILATILCKMLAESDIYTEKAMYYAQRKAVRFKDSDFVDLYDFLKILQDKYAGDSSELVIALNGVINLITNENELKPIIENVTSGVRFDRVKGLSIYSPVRGYSRFYERLDFFSRGWGNVIRLLNEVTEEKREVTEEERQKNKNS